MGETFHPDFGSIVWVDREIMRGDARSMTCSSALGSTLRVEALTQEVTSGSLLCSIRINHFESGSKVLQRGIERPNVSIIKLDSFLAEPNEDSSEKQLRV